jgi:hypothetical protein
LEAERNVDEAPRPTQQRSGCLTVFLATALVGFCSVSGLVLFGGFFVWFALLVGGMLGYAGLSYVLWGRALSEQTAGEREEWQAEQPRWAAADPRRPREE